MLPYPPTAFITQCSVVALFVGILARLATFWGQPHCIICDIFVTVSLFAHEEAPVGLGVIIYKMKTID